MQEQLINFETAKLAKEKGLCDYFENSPNNTQYIPSFYSEDGINFEETEFQLEDCVILDRFYRPTQSLLQKWLREVHNIEIYVRSSVGLYNKKYWTTFLPNGCLENKNNTYEEALEVGLFEALKLI
jgi:hypothetical protein